ncbi:hypothetical protein SAMN05421863_102937 [Nitrosomonas communis]|uniref:Uncharacterized protein n=1 Tax=Nitrosomonas communis TaxID=44574 RepID=A0A1I4QZV3_9PROT|nr:hypothetical protein SAMN05421863_102937 [Nitrosomonas communis]
MLKMGQDNLGNDKICSLISPFKNKQKLNDRNFNYLS